MRNKPRTFAEPPTLWHQEHLLQAERIRIRTQGRTPCQCGAEATTLFIGGTYTRWLCSTCVSGQPTKGER